MLSLIKQESVAVDAWKLLTLAENEVAETVNLPVGPLLVPIALRGVRYRPVGASALLRRNLLVYGLGGVIAPFVGIKLIDLVVHNVLGA